MKNTDKVTLTFGQLKRLIKESIDDEDYGTEFYWSINELTKDGNGEWETYSQVEGPDWSFSDVDEAYADGIQHLKRYTDGHYELEVWNEDGDIMVGAEMHDGILTEY